MFIGGRKINDGRDKHCGCNLGERADISNRPLKELLHITTAAALARVCLNAMQGRYKSVQLPWNQQEFFFYQLTGALNHIRNERARPQQQHQHTGLGGVTHSTCP